MKKMPALCALICCWATPSTLLADESPGLASQLAIEGRVSPLGAASFEGIRGNSFKQISIGLGFYHPRALRLMVRNTFGPIAISPLGGGAMARADGVEVLAIQPLPGLSPALERNNLVPYLGWGFALTIVSIRPDLHRGYSSVVLESGFDLRQRAYLNIGGFRVSLRTVLGGENITVGLFLGTVLHPVSIASEFLN